MKIYIFIITSLSLCSDFFATALAFASAPLFAFLDARAALRRAFATPRAAARAALDARMSLGAVVCLRRIEVGRYEVDLGVSHGAVSVGI